MKTHKKSTALYLRKLAAAPLCLALLLSSCAKPAVLTETVKLKPPIALLSDCEQSQFNGTTYADAVSFLSIALNERQRCAEKLRKVKEWVARD